MSSIKKENIEKCSAQKEDPDIDDKLADLSCPFTWEMEDVIKNRHQRLDADKKRFERVVDIQDDFPEFVLIYHLILVYENVESKEAPNVMQSLNKAEESLADIKQKATLEDVANALEHIFIATKCHVLQKWGQTTEADELLEGICDVDNMNKAESAMLNGCQCLAWSLYSATDNSMAIKCAQKAIEYEDDNGKWYFLLGQNYTRSRRRHILTNQRPSIQETIAFKKAFNLSKSVMFGLSLARLYRESLKYDMANGIYKEIYDLQPTCCKVRLQLALGFIQARQRNLAKNCLDYVANQMPDSATYEYHMAMYEERCNNDFKAALTYYKSATEKKEFVAEWKYIECRKKVEPDWDPILYMKDLQKKYGKDSDQLTQEINIKIGSYYLWEKRDILSACIILAKAIEISPDSKLLKQHDVLFSGFRVNIYHVLASEIQFVLQNFTTTLDDDSIAIFKNTSKLCGKYCKNLPKNSESYSAHGSSSQFRNTSRTKNQDISFHGALDIEKKPRHVSFHSSLMKHPSKNNDNDRRSAIMFKDKRDSVSKDHVRDRDGERRIRQTESLKPLDRDCNKDLASSSASPLAQGPSSKISNRYRNNNRGNSSREGIGVRDERPSSSSRSIHENHLLKNRGDEKIPPLMSLDPFHGKVDKTMESAGLITCSIYGQRTRGRGRGKGTGRGRGEDSGRGSGRSIQQTAFSNLRDKNDDRDQSRGRGRDRSIQQTAFSNLPEKNNDRDQSRGRGRNIQQTAFPNLRDKNDDRDQSRGRARSIQQTAFSNLRDKKDNRDESRGRGRSNQQTAFPNLRDENDDREGFAACCIVKTKRR